MEDRKRKWLTQDRFSWNFMQKWTPMKLTERLYFITEVIHTISHYTSIPW